MKPRMNRFAGKTGQSPKKRPFHGERRNEGRPAAKPDTGWHNVAGWYSQHLDSGDTYQEAVVFPGTEKLLGAGRGQSVLDVACGEGSFAERLVKRGIRVFGVDAAPGLIAHAKERRLPQSEFVVGDARHLDVACRGRRFDAATCILAIQNIADVPPVFRGVAATLPADAPFVIVTNHPAYRIPRQSAWGWDDQRMIMYRRVDRYLEPLAVPIVMNPGRQAERGAKPITTMTYHRPISFYVNALADAGFVTERIEEWTSHRESDSGPRAKAENRAREEFPLFLAIKARRG